MFNSTISRSFLLAIMILITASTTFAVDQWHGPSRGDWKRGDPGSTWQKWEFETSPSDDHIPPDAMNNPYVGGTPGPFVIIPEDIESGNYWSFEEVPCPDPLATPPCHGLRASSWGVKKTMQFVIPNSPDHKPAKWIFIQITESSSSPTQYKFFVPDHAANDSLAEPTFKYGDVAETNTTNPNFLVWGHMFALDQNPFAETIEILFPDDAIVEEVVIDTICWDPSHPVDTEPESWSTIKSLFR